MQAKDRRSAPALNCCKIDYGGIYRKYVVFPDDKPLDSVYSMDDQVVPGVLLSEANAFHDVGGVVPAPPSSGLEDG